MSGTVGTVRTHKVSLVTRQGEGVITTDIPNFDPLPEVLHWGSRYFVLHGNVTTGIKYVEGLCYEIVGQVTAPKEVTNIATASDK